MLFLDGLIGIIDSMSTGGLAMQKVGQERRRRVLRIKKESRRTVLRAPEVGGKWSCVPLKSGENVFSIRGQQVELSLNHRCLEND